MLTITGEIDGIELGRDSSPAKTDRSLRAGASGYVPDNLSPALWSPPSRRRDALTLICPDARGASAVIDAQKLKIYYANKEARRLFAQGHHFRAERGTLVVAVGTATERLRRAFAAVQSDSTQLVILDDEIWGAASMRISAVDLGDDRLAKLTIVDFAAERAALSGEELAALTCGFGLTDAEAAIAGLLVDGLSLEQIAETRGVQRETVRNQCKTLLGKMHCHRQVDLVRMALSLCARPGLAVQFQSNVGQR